MLVLANSEAESVSTIFCRKQKKKAKFNVFEIDSFRGDVRWYLSWEENHVVGYNITTIIIIKTDIANNNDNNINYYMAD